MILAPDLLFVLLILLLAASVMFFCVWATVALILDVWRSSIREYLLQRCVQTNYQSSYSLRSMYESYRKWCKGKDRMAAPRWYFHRHVAAQYGERIAPDGEVAFFVSMDLAVPQ